MDFATLKYTAGDTLPAITGRFTEDDNETGINLTGFEIHFSVNFPTPLTKVANLIDVADGTWSVLFAEGELIPGIWFAEIKVISPSGIYTMNEVTDPYTGDTEPLKVSISPSIEQETP